MHRLAERTGVRLGLFALLALAAVWSMLPTAAWANQFRDAEVLALHEHAAVDTVKRFAELPLWDPWYCGGLYGLGAPQSRFAAPPFLLSLLLGPERATPVVVFLLSVLGMEGTYRWLRLRIADGWSALRIAPFFALCGHFAVAHYRGWTGFFGFELVPFVLLGTTLAARGRVVGIALSGLAFAFILGFGGTFAAPLLAVALLVEAVRSYLEQPRTHRRRAAFLLLALASFLVTLAMFRLFPIAETLAASPRIMAGTPGHSPKTLLFQLVKSLDPAGGDVDANGLFYVGGAFVALVALGGSDRRSITPVFLVVLFLWLAAGYARKPPLFALLRALPVFSALRYPERFLWIGILYASEPAANALAKLPLLGEGRRWRTGVDVVLTAVIALTVGTQIDAFGRLGGARQLAAIVEGPKEDFHQARGNRWLAAHYQARNVGSLSCWEAYPVTMSTKLRGDLAAEEYLADPAAGTVVRRAWSPNRIELHVALRAPARLLVNQNWHPGWRASIGDLVSDEGLLAVDLPAGEHDVTLRFAPRSALAGAVVSGVALLGLTVLLGAKRRSRGPRRAMLLSAATLAPWIVFLGFVATWTEPRFPPPTLRNADGSPAFEAVPPDATRLDAELTGPITVDAYRLTGPDALGSLGVEVWLRRTGDIPRTTALFARVEREDRAHPVERGEKEKGDVVLNADHQVVGGSFYLSDAPLGVEVHDAFGVNLDKLAPSRYEVRIGFGHVSGKRGTLGGFIPLGAYDHE